MSQVYIKPGSEDLFAQWQAKLNAAITVSPGFVSLEFLAPAKEEDGWLVVERFYSSDFAMEWGLCEKQKELRQELEGLAIENGIKDVSACESSINQGITDVIVTEVQPENEVAFRAWTAKIHAAEAKFPGFRGVYVQSPGANGKHWITLLQFDTAYHLDEWLNSNERKAVLDESHKMITSLERHRIISPYSGWFSSIAKAGEIPAAWKQTMIVLLVLFPIVMLEFKFLNPWLTGLNRALGTFIGNAISVLLIAFPATPIAIWFLKWWLVPQGANKTLKTVLGTLLVLGLYALSIALFWNFL